MENSASSIEFLSQRMARIERENRGLRRMIISGVLILCGWLVVAVATGLRAQTRTVPRVVEAQSFVVKDASGRVRGEFGTKGINEDAVVLTFRRISGEPAASLIGEEHGAQFGLFTPGGYPEKGANLSAGNNFGGVTGPHLNLTGDEKVDLSAGGIEPGIRLRDNKGNRRIELTWNSDGASLSFSDAQGFSTTIGNTELETPSTGETHKTSAASIRMFNDKGSVIWAAPSQ